MNKKNCIKIKQYSVGKVKRCKVVVAPKKGKMKLCIYREITDAGKTKFEIVQTP